VVAHANQTTYQLSGLGQVYQNVYNRLAGTGTSIKPWHFQWLGAYALQRNLKARLSTVHGRLLDVGCEQKPYGVFLDPSVVHVGIDLFAGPKVDVIYDGTHIPFPDHSFDAILCTQVMEHAEDAEQVRNEMLRVLKPGGQLILTVPFIYCEHSAPYDFRRFSLYGVDQFFGKQLEIKELASQGAIGSTLGVMFLNWYDTQMDRNKITRLLKGITLPLYLPGTFLINMAGFLLDKIDRTNDFYHNVLLVGVKGGKQTQGEPISSPILVEKKILLGV